MKNAILVINTGSSSLKFSLYEIVEQTLKQQFHGQIENIKEAPLLSVFDEQDIKIISKHYFTIYDLKS